MEVAPERLLRWCENFAGRHGAFAVDATPVELVLTAADGARAVLAVPFPPLSVPPEPGQGAGSGDVPADAAHPALAALVHHTGRERRFGLLLVRLGGFAVGVVQGVALVASKVGARPVHGRSAAGGWSQQRFARRREGQARVALAAAADAAATVLLPAGVEAVVTGGDRRAVGVVLEDRRLAGLASLVVARVLDVPDPKRVVLESAVPRARAVVVTVTELR